MHVHHEVDEARYKDRPTQDHQQEDDPLPDSEPDPPDAHKLNPSSTGWSSSRSNPTRVCSESWSISQTVAPQGLRCNSTGDGGKAEAPGSRCDFNPEPLLLCEPDPTKGQCSTGELHHARESLKADRTYQLTQASPAESPAVRGSRIFLRFTGLRSRQTQADTEHWLNNDGEARTLHTCCAPGPASIDGQALHGLASFPSLSPATEGGEALPTF